MKKIIIVLLFLVTISFANEVKKPPEVKIMKQGFDGHSYIIATSKVILQKSGYSGAGGGGAVSIIHSPDCKCHNNKGN